MATIFQNALANAKAKGIERQTTKEAIDWFRKNLRKTAVNNDRLMREEQENMVAHWKQVRFGGLYFFKYDPKHKETLPVYDTFPMIIPIGRYDNGLLGINLHYLQPSLRAVVLDELYGNLTDRTITEQTRLIKSYASMKKLSNHRMIYPCVKRYLGNHVRSRFIKVPVENWTPAVFLPTERMVKMSRTEAWNNSRKQFK